MFSRALALDAAASRDPVAPVEAVEAGDEGGAHDEVVVAVTGGAPGHRAAGAGEGFVLDALCTRTRIAR